MNKHISSSFHTINYDKPLSDLRKIQWFACNFLNNSFKDYLIDNEIIELNFNLRNKDIDFNQVSFENSPLRYLSNLFWYNLPWNLILENLGDLKILEVGCGRGTYGKLIQSLVKDRMKLYTGIDIFKKNEWKNFDDKFSFHIDNCYNVSKYLENKNFIFTMTAIEHFEKDIIFFREINDYLEKSKKSIMQIHIMPSYSCLRTYLGHGIRQYNMRNISKVTKLFNSSSQKFIVPLGNKHFNNLTFEYITIPRIKKVKDKRKIEPNKYKNELLKLLQTTNNSNHKPTAYALIIFNNFQKKIDFQNDKIF